MANRNSVCESSPALRNLKQKNTFQIRDFNPFLWKLHYYCIQRKKERKIRFRTCFLVVWSTMEILKFCTSSYLTLIGPRALVEGKEHSLVLSAVGLHSCLPPPPCLTCMCFRLRHPAAGCLDELELLVLPQVLWGLSWKRQCFQGQPVLSPLDELYSRCHGTRSTTSGGCRKTARKRGKNHCFSLQLQQPVHTWKRDGRKKEMKAESGEITS